MFIWSGLDSLADGDEYVSTRGIACSRHLILLNQIYPADKSSLRTHGEKNVVIVVKLVYLGQVTPDKYLI